MESSLRAFLRFGQCNRRRRGPRRNTCWGRKVKHQIAAEEIYSALVDDDRFATLPARLAKTFGGRSTVIHWHHRDGSAEVLAHSKYFSDEQLRRYADEFARIDPWAEAAAREQAPNQALDLETLVPSSLYERSVFYNEFIRGMGDDTYRCMGVRIQNEWGAGMIAIQRGKGQDGYDSEAVAKLSETSVHLRRMLSVRGKFAALEHRAKSLQMILDFMPQATLLVDESGTLLLANAAGEALLRRGDVLSVRRGRIEAAARQCVQVLKRALQLACSSTPSGGAVLLECKATRPLLATVIPVPSGGKGRNALLLMHDRDLADVGLDRQLQSLFGLTAAEAAIARRLADGLSLKEIADERKASLGTVRAQVKFLSQKMGCHRQGEIVSVVKSIVPGRPHEALAEPAAAAYSSR